MSLSTRTQAEEAKLTTSLEQLSNIMNSLRRCVDIDCLERDTSRLLILTNENVDLWNWNTNEYDDYIVMGLRQTIFKIPEIIENNANFNFDFSDRSVSSQYRRIKDNVENIFGLLHMDIDVQTIMDTGKDIGMAVQLHERINSIEYQRQEQMEIRRQTEQRLLEQLQEERRIEEMAVKAQLYWQEVKERERQRRLETEKELEDSMNNLALLDKEKQELEEEINIDEYDQSTYEDEWSGSEFPEDEDFGTV